MTPVDDHSELLIRGVLQATASDSTARQCALLLIEDFRKAKAELAIARAQLYALGVEPKRAN